MPLPLGGQTAAVARPSRRRGAAKPPLWCGQAVGVEQRRGAAKLPPLCGQAAAVVRPSRRSCAAKPGTPRRNGNHKLRPTDHGPRPEPQSLSVTIKTKGNEIENERESENATENDPNLQTPRHLACHASHACRDYSY